MRLLSALTYWAARTSTVLWRPMVGRRWLPMWAMLHTRGRRTGRRYSTPVQVRTHGQWFVIALPWPGRSQWLRNVEAGGGCRLTWRGEEHGTDAPERIGYAQAAPAYNRFEQLLIRLTGLDHFLRLRRPARRGEGESSSALS